MFLFTGLTLNIHQQVRQSVLSSGYAHCTKQSVCYTISSKFQDSYDESGFTSLQPFSPQHLTWYQLRHPSHVIQFTSAIAHPSSISGGSNLPHDTQDSLGVNAQTTLLFLQQAEGCLQVGIFLYFL